MIKRFTHGVDNEVYLMKNKSQSIVVKKYTKRHWSDVRRIANVMKKLHAASFPVPRIYHVVQSTSKQGIVLMEKMPGKHRRHPKREECAEVATLMATLHRTFRDQELPFVPLNKKNVLCYRSACMNDEITNCVDRVFSSCNRLSSLPVTFIHGDFSLSNILFRGKNVSALLDIDHAATSFAIIDLARAQIFFSFDKNNHYLPEKAENFIRCYERVRPLTKKEKSAYFDALRLSLIKMLLDTYYFVEIAQAVPKKTFRSDFNQSHQTLLKKLMSLEKYEQHLLS